MMFAWFQPMGNSFAFPEGEHIARVIGAIVFGGLIGLEREIRDKPVGFRTVVLICVAVCIFTIVSEEVGGPDMDTTRIAAQIVTGIGFLGAGAILRGKRGIYGLTTAATIWAVAAVGMSVGFGRFGLAVLGTGAILVALLLFDLIESWIGARLDIQNYRLMMANSGTALEQVTNLFAAGGLRTIKKNWYEDASSLVFEVRALGAKQRHEEMRFRLARSDEYTLLKS